MVITNAHLLSSQPINQASSTMSNYRDKFVYPESPATPEEVELLEKWLGNNLPSEYKKFLLETNGAETPIGVQEPDDSIVLWSAKEVSELTEAYCYEQYTGSNCYWLRWRWRINSVRYHT